MNIQTSAMVVAISVMTVAPAFAGGAKIIIRQGYGHGHTGPAFGTGPVATWLMKEGGMILQSEFGGRTSSSPADWPPALRAPSPDQNLSSLLDRLDKLNGTTPTTTNTTSNSGSPVFVTPPIVSNAPGGRPIPPAQKSEPTIVPQ